MNKRRLFASAMAACMLLSTMPSTVLAADTSPDATIVSNAEDSTTDPSNSNEINWTEVNDLEGLQNATTDQGKINIKLGADITSDKRVLTVKDGQNITLDLNGYKITSKGDYTISVEHPAESGEGWFGGEHTDTGELTIIGEGTIENTNDRSSTIRNYGTLTIGQKGDEEFPTIIRTDITNPNNSAVKCEEDSKLTIYGGTFEGNKRSVQNFGKTEIYGGTFKDSVEAWKYQEYDSTLTIYGGEFKGAVESCNKPGSQEYKEKGTLSISGGTFHDASAFAYLADKADIKLGANIESDKRVLTVKQGQNITLDLNGHDITSKGKYTISVENAAKPGEGSFGGTNTSGNLTIIGEGTITNINDQSSTIRNYGTLTIGEQRSEVGPTITRVQSENTENSAVKCEEKSTLTIYGGTFGGNERSVQNFGTTNIYGGTFEKSVEAWKYQEYDSTLTIYGGEFKGAVESCKSQTDQQYQYQGDLFIEGGYFVVDPTEYLAKGYMVKDSEGNYEVVNVVAWIDNISYASLQDAVDAALNAGATSTQPATIQIMPSAAIPSATVNKVGTFIIQDGVATTTNANITAGSSVNMTTTQVDKGVQYTFTAKPTTTPDYDYGGGSYNPPVSSGSNTTTQKNPDGSTTTTKTDKDGTVTETTKHTDGSTSTVETAKDGTVTTTEKDAKGNKTETVEKTDGTKEFTAKQKDGSEATASVDRNGTVKAEVELTQKALNNAATNNEAVTLPIPAISVDKFSAASTITVDLPDNTGKTSVVVPMEEMTPGSVVVMVLPDGTEKVVIATKTVEEGLAVELDGDCTFKVVDNSKDFADVKPGDWFSDATDFVSSRELFAGTSETEFSPNAEMTMEMLFAVAHNFMGKPERTGTNDIAGAKPEDWFHTASNWAAEIGLTNGLKMDMLGSNLPISREDTAILLYNLAGVDYTPSEEAMAKLNSFSDIADMDPDNLTALAWVVENGIMNGMGDGTFGFKGNNTRAQTGAIMMNFNNNL